MTHKQVIAHLYGVSDGLQEMLEKAEANRTGQLEDEINAIEMVIDLLVSLQCSEHVQQVWDNSSSPYTSPAPDRTTRYDRLREPGGPDSEGV